MLLLHRLADPKQHVMLADMCQACTVCDTPRQLALSRGAADVGLAKMLTREKTVVSTEGTFDWSAPEARPPPHAFAGCMHMAPACLLPAGSIGQTALTRLSGELCCRCWQGSSAQKLRTSGLW